MIDIRLKTEKIRWDGREYELRCNMNVLAEVQAANGGSIRAALGKPSAQSGLEFLAAMLNDYADEMGWPADFTAKSVGRRIPAREMSGLLETVLSLVSDSLRQDGGDEPSEGAEDAEKNE